MKRDAKELAGSELGHFFMHDFIYTRGTHILGLGQTGTGKSNKGFQINKMLVDSGETLGVMDCGKPGEILPYCHFGLPLNFIIPSGCDVIIKGSPVPVFKNYAETPELNWHYPKRDMINIFTFREHILDDLTNGEYTARFMDVLSKQVMRNKIEIPLPFCIDCDECADVIPAYGLIENRYQKEAAAKFAKVLKKIRYKGIRVHAKDQSWGDVYPNARRQFPFLCLSRSPGTDGKTDIGVIKRYGFEALAVNEAKMIFPQRNWWGTWEFDYVPPPEGVTIEYEGEVFWPRTRRKDEGIYGRKKTELEA